MIHDNDLNYLCQRHPGHFCLVPFDKLQLPHDQWLSTKKPLKFVSKVLTLVSSL